MRRRVKVIVVLTVLVIAVTYGYPVYSAFRWSSRLAVAAANADRLRVWEGGPNDFDPSFNRIRFETRDTNIIAQVLTGIKGRSEGYLHCMCFGAPTLVFYRDEQQLAAVSVKHGKQLLWYRNSHGDVTPTARSMAFLKDFFTKHGVTNAEME